jgi:lysozyme
MNPRHKASRAAIDLIKRFEGFRPAATQLADGRWTIGYGHVRTARQGVTISEQDAEALLLYDLMEIQGAVNEATFTALTQNQFDALVAFAFNIGLENFRRSSALRRVNEGDLIQAACAIEMWRKADLGGERLVVDALVRRRAAEKALFLTPDKDAWTPAPSAIVRPRVDYDVAHALPRKTVELTEALMGSEASAPATLPPDEAAIERLRGLNLAEAEAGIDLNSAPPAEPEDPEGLLEPQPTDSGRPIAHRETPSAEAAASDSAWAKPEGLPLLVIGGVGLAIFAAAILLGGNLRGSGLMSPAAVAWVLGVLGILLVSGAVYFLLTSLSDRGDER